MLICDYDFFFLGWLLSTDDCSHCNFLAVVVCIQWCIGCVLDCKHYRWINNVEGHNSNSWIGQTSMFTWHDSGAWQQMNWIMRCARHYIPWMDMRLCEYAGDGSMLVMLRVERSIGSRKLNIFVLHETWCRYWMFVHAENVKLYPFALHLIRYKYSLSFTVFVFYCVRFLNFIAWSRMADAARISDHMHGDGMLLDGGLWVREFASDFI